jgi:NhaA family Na+:H+ antiporter
VIGKPVGIVLATWLAVRLRLAALPGRITWWHVASVGLVAGIGFTVSLFIADLAFEEGGTLDTAKIAILLASSVAGLVGYSLLRITSSSPMSRPRDS